MSATVSEPVPAIPSLLTRGEELFSPAAIAKQIPSHRKKAHVNGATVFRWITRGVRTAGGDVIRLEAVKVGCFWRTSLEAVERFTSALTAASLPTDTTPSATPTPTPKQQQSAAKAASKEADKIFGATKPGK